MRDLKIDLIRTMDERDRRDSLIVKLDKEALNLRSLAEIYENDVKLLHDKIERTMYVDLFFLFYNDRLVKINLNIFINFSDVEKSNETALDILKNRVMETNTSFSHTLSLFESKNKEYLSAQNKLSGKLFNFCT